MPKPNERREFLADVVHPAIEDDILDSAIDWIAKNMKVEDVFPDDEIAERAAQTDDPSEVFSEKQLRDWALENGFVEAVD